MLRNALINSIDNGIGLAIADALKDEGINVYCLAYKDYDNEGMKVVRVNNALDDVIKHVLKDSGSIDILVNTPLYAHIGMFEDISIEDIIAQFNANIFNVIRIIKAVIPVMKGNGRGLIVNIGSLAGMVGFPGISAYSSSMFALEGLSECLRYELMNYGIYTVIVEPGAVKSDKALIKSSNTGNNAFEGIYKGLMHLIEHGLDARDVARTVLSIVKSNKPKLRYIVGEHAFLMLDSKRSMSEDEFEELVRKDVGL